MIEADVDTVRGMYDAFARRDLDAIREAIASDFEMEQSDVLPWGGKRSGPDGFFGFLGTLLSYVEPIVETGDLMDAGDHIVQVGHTSGTVISNGARFRLREVHAWRLRAGKVIGYRVYVDTVGMLAALNGEDVVR